MLPEAFLERMQRMLGNEYEDFLESFERKKHQALRLNALKRNIDGLSASEWEWEYIHLENVPWAENGYYYENTDQPGKHPFHEAGLYYIQEPSAMAPVELLDVRPGERVLDLCAAPGGKSTQIAAKLSGRGFLVCNEIHPARAKILSENVERMGIGNVCVTNETPAHLAEIFSAYFDKILVDAPCSGEGMFRKNEAACDEWSPENVLHCGERQDEILDCAAAMLRPGGRLVYSTCTFAPVENEGSIYRFLNRHKDFEIVNTEEVKTALGLEGCDGEPKWAGADEGPEGDVVSEDHNIKELVQTLRLWPHKINGEGHYAAVLQKSGSVPDGYRPGVVNGGIKPVKEKELGDFTSFCRENLKCDVAKACGLSGDVQYMKFGDHIYLVPLDMPGLKGMKVLRPGLHLGEMKKNRFEPSHALALALWPKYAEHVYNLDSEESQIRDYLGGLTFSAEGQKGWYLVCVDGFGIGWGKLAGGIMKNHYPRGLRK